VRPVLPRKQGLDRRVHNKRRRELIERTRTHRRLMFESLEGRRLLAFSVGAQEVQDQADASIREDLYGRNYCVLPTATSIAKDDSLALAPLTVGKQGSGASITLQSLIVPIYHSNPGATKKIYLDFDGQTVLNTVWNNRNYIGTNSPNPINAPAYSMDSDYANFSAAELTSIREIWARVSEDYAPFNVDVTTENPGEAQFTLGSRAMRALISTDYDALTGTPWFANAGGVAYLNSWTWTDASPVWIFANKLANGTTKYVAEAVSHEVGHAMNLQHDGRNNPSEGYYQGHGSGATGWAPIMGVGYYRELVQWSKGEYASANNTEDDLAIIAAKLGYRLDDHGDNPSTATALNVAADATIDATGIIASRTDIDAFRFLTQAGQVTLSASPFEFDKGKANLDVQVTLLNAAGITVATVNPIDTLNAAVTINLAKGYYTVMIDGVGKAAVSGDQGYSDYASIGQYSLSGTVVKNRNPVLTVTNSDVTGWEGTTVSNSGTWSDPDVGDIVSLSASSGNIIKNSDGSWSWSLFFPDQQPLTTVTITATDDLGGTTSQTFTVEVSNQAPQLTVSQALISGSVLASFTNMGEWQDVPGDNVVLSASLGLVTRYDNGTWSWSYVPTAATANQVVSIYALDKDGGSSSVSFSFLALVDVVNTKVYYKGSSFANTSVDAALDSTIEIAKSGGTSKTLSFANLINSSSGINGLLLDVAGLASANLQGSDFTFRVSPTGAFNEATNPPSSWIDATAPSLIDVIDGGVTSPSRVRLEWPDDSIVNRWLQIRILASARTGLLAPQTYYIGHLYGETNGTLTDGSFLVQIADINVIRPGVGSIAPVTSRIDLNKNGLVQVSDILLMRSFVGIGILRNITIPASGSDAEGEGNSQSNSLPIPLAQGFVRGTESRVTVGLRWTDPEQNVIFTFNKTFEALLIDSRVPQQQPVRDTSVIIDPRAVDDLFGSQTRKRRSLLQSPNPAIEENWIPDTFETWS